MASGSSDDVGNEVYFLIEDVCRYLNDGVKVYISNDQGSCWSNITFKKDIPTIIGRRTTVYCDNPIVSDPKVFINGVPPIAFVPCQGLRTPKFVADWVFPRVCEPGIQDTVKQILREWEFFDKDGNPISGLVIYKIESNPGAGLWRPHNDQLPLERKGEGVYTIFKALGDRAKDYKNKLAKS